MDLSVLFLFLGIFCWGTLWYLANCQKHVKSWKTIVIRWLIVVSVICLSISPVDWVGIIGEEEVSLKWVGVLNYLCTLFSLWGGAMLVLAIFYPLLSFTCQCEMDEVLEKFLS